MDLSCDTYRISEDSNQNVQIFKLERYAKLFVNGENLNDSDLISGHMMDLNPGFDTKGIYKSKDGKGNYEVSISVLEKITSAYGFQFISRSHDFDVYKVSAKVSRNGKTHEFIGTCTSEILTSCGGNCDTESSVKDLL
ncbi:hypothetical protein N9O57_00505 [bacterium]|nr:hypothetical protein [bacterium]